MIKNYFKTAFRNITGQPAYAAINFTGLSVGLASCIFIWLFIQDELSYDQSFAEKDRLFRVTMTWTFGETVIPSGAVTSGTGSFLQENFPQVEAQTRLLPREMGIKVGEQAFLEEGFLYADSTVFKVLGYQLREGNPAIALVEPNSLVISTEVAERYFGSDWETQGVIGKTVEVNETQLFKITGVLEEIPGKSHISFDGLASMSSRPDAKNPNWDNSEYANYLLLYPDGAASATQLLAQVPKRLNEVLGEGSSDMILIDLEPIDQVYLYSTTSNQVGSTSDSKYVYIFGAIGLLIMLIACINYLNLATARSLERAKEVGLRKVLGAIRGQLFWQFMSEAIIFTTGAMAGAFLLVFALIPWFNQFSGKELATEWAMQPGFWAVILSLGLLVSILAGSYPALILSSFKPLTVLKGKFRNSSAGNILRKALVTFQLSISLFLLIFTLVIWQQLSLVKSHNLGYDKERLLSMEADTVITNRLGTFKNQLRQIAGLEDVGLVSQTPVNITGKSALAKFGEDEERKLISYATVDQDFINTMQLDVTAGKEFKNASYPDDGFLVMINEAALEFFEWETAEEAVGNYLMVWGSEKCEIVGIVKDFHFRSLKIDVEPLVMISAKEPLNFASTLVVRINGQDISGTLAQMESVWKNMFPHRPFNYNFLDNQFAQLYQSEEKLGNVFSAFAIVALVIACLGLFGLSSYNTLQRSKEIGIRKVLGAPVFSIIKLLTSGYFKLMGIALLFVIPVANYFVREWLGGFAYKLELSWWIFALPVAALLTITLLAIGGQSMKAALANPAHTLRNE